MPMVLVVEVVAFLLLTEHNREKKYISGALRQDPALCLND